MISYREGSDFFVRIKKFEQGRVVYSRTSRGSLSKQVPGAAAPDRYVDVIVEEMACVSRVVV